jgi:cytosine/adenosine deaminase-related metal-dependent hydrolase
MPASWTLGARWIFPVSSPPVEDGFLTLAGERIVSVEPRRGRRADLDLGQAAILPGLVNAHTHLDLSGLGGLAAPTAGFTSWLGQVIAHRRQRSGEQVDADIGAGLAESLRHGVTLVGDIAAGGRSWELVAAAPLRAVVFFELLGLSRVRAGSAWAAALHWLRTHWATPSCRPGISPHAPYSVRTSLFRAAAALAANASLPVMTHLAESPEELQLLAERQGPLVPFLEGLGVWDPEGLSASPQAIVQAAAACPQLLLVHGNYLDPADELPPAATIVYCPRTHAFFGHQPHGFRKWLARGVRVALGTDSLASTPDLDVRAEARFLHLLAPDLPGAALLRIITLAGAEALGWDQETGSLTPGKSADCVVLPIWGEATDPHDLLWSEQEPTGVLFRGRWQKPIPPGR